MGTAQIDDEDITKAICYRIVGDVKTFSCELEQERSIEYYDGKAFIDGEREVDVTFIVQSIEEEHVKMKFFRIQSVKHSRVMHPHFYTKHDKKTLICYDKIDSFLTDEIRKERVKRVDNVPEPNDVTACDIRELSMGLEEIHKNGLHFFDLEDSRRYVISKGKIKFCDDGVSEKMTEKEDKKKEAKAKIDWDRNLKTQIRKFGRRVEWLLSTDSNVHWPEKDSFLLCFDKVTPRDLRVIYAHPFLMRNKKYAFQILADADHALTSHDNDVRDYTSLINKVLDEDFGKQIITENRWWTDDKFQRDGVLFKVLWYGVEPYSSPTNAPTSDASSSSVTVGTSSALPPLRTTFQPQNDFGQPEGQSSIVQPKPNYGPTRLRDLIRFSRNVYEHYCEHGSRIEDVHDEIKRHWPKLIDIIHVASWTTT